MKENCGARLLAYVTGMINQELLLKNEHLAAENRILRALSVAITQLKRKINRLQTHTEVTAPRGIIVDIP